MRATLDRQRVCQSLYFGLVEGTLELMAIENTGEIEQCSCGRSHRDPANNCDFVGFEAVAMELHARLRVPTSSHGHLDIRPR